MIYQSKAFIDKALSYVGYLEKASEKSLDDFTANAGDKNYTRFCRDYETYTGQTGFQPSYWCAEFISCVVVEAFGLTVAKELLCGSLFASCTIGRDQFRKRCQFHIENPLPGDIVLFYNTKRNGMAHCGIVTKVTDTHVYTVEGNTSSSSNIVIDNGGAVAEKKYSINYNRIAGYCRMALDGRDPTVNAYEGNDIAVFQRWLNDKYKSNLAIDGVCEKNTKHSAIKALQTHLNNVCGASLVVDGLFGTKTKQAVETLSKGSNGNSVFIMQGMLYCHGFDPNGFDGIFGSGCESAVMDFQRKHFPAKDVDGICGRKTWSQLMK